MPRTIRRTHDDERFRLAELARRRSTSGREIGPLPAIVNPDRRSSCGDSLQLFCETYHPQVFTLGWSPDHLTVISKLETTIRDGGLFALGMPRGSGKTSLILCAVEWALVYGFRRFVVLVASEEGLASSLLASIKVDFESNELLLQDFPETAFPIHRLERINNRARGQRLNGQPTAIEITQKRLVLPSIPNSPASGAVVHSVGITGSIRGLVHRTQDGANLRPDLVLVDDPQSDEVARSSTQISQREQIIKSTLLGLAGPGCKIAGLVACTVIEPHDLAARLLDPKVSPEWQPEKFGIARSLPTNEKLWSDYDEVRRNGLADGKGLAPATEFYLKHRSKMDIGCVPSWDQRFNPDEASATQHLMNLKLTDERSFWAEYQNDPQVAKTGSREIPDPNQLAERLSKVPRGVVPDRATRLVAFVDVQKTALYFAVVAFDELFTAWVIDYGVYPKQSLKYFTLAQIKRTTLQSVAGTDDLNVSIFKGLTALYAEVFQPGYHRADGTVIPVEVIGIDSGWGLVTDTVDRFAERAPITTLPTHGKYIRTASRDRNPFRARAGERAGSGWIIRKGDRKSRHCTVDTNVWKSQLFDSLNIEPGAAGSMTFFGTKAEAHRMVCDHLRAERPTLVTSNGISAEEWQQLPGRPDNHLFDCLVGCLVMASTLGVRSTSAVDPHSDKVSREVKKIRYSEIVANRQRNYSGVRPS